MIRKNFPLPRVLAAHDLSGFGRAALSVVIPVISSMGIQVCPLPTALLSSHSAYPGYTYKDLSDDMRKILKHWNSLNLDFDCLYTGFLGGLDQLHILQSYYENLKELPYVIIDPVMGDDGKIYKSIDNVIVPAMREWIKNANVITPNLTEAALLLNTDIRELNSETAVRDALKALSSMGPENVLITSVPDSSRPMWTSVLAYQSDSGRFWKVSCEHIPAKYPGTGDAFASVLTGSLLQGDSLPIALDRAIQFTTLAIRATFGHDHPPSEGIFIEKVLSSLNEPVRGLTYQLLAEES